MECLGWRLWFECSAWGAGPNICTWVFKLVANCRHLFSALWIINFDVCCTRWHVYNRGFVGVSTIYRCKTKTYLLQTIREGSVECNIPLKALLTIRNSACNVTPVNEFESTRSGHLLFPANASPPAHSDGFPNKRNSLEKQFPLCFLWENTFRK